MFYFVEPYDSVESIARKFQVSKTHLVQFNPSIYYYPLYIGQILFIPPDPRSMIATGDTLDSIIQTSNTSNQELTNPRTTQNYRPIIEYEVKPGDTLDSIARKYGTTKQSIMQLNGLVSEAIQGGQKLRINSSRQNDSYNDNYRPIIEYEVKPGDTLDSIAKKYGTTKQSIMQLNGLVSEAIQGGQKLRINSSRQDDSDINTDRQVTEKFITPKSKYKFTYLYDMLLDKKIYIWKEWEDQKALFFISKMIVTAAGAPKAFHKENNLALDYLENSGVYGNWWGLVTEEEGFPVVQGPNEPAPGYFVSKTALSDCKKTIDDPERYVDSTVIPYITLPFHHMIGAELGDFCVVINTRNNKIGYAIIADLGPDDSIGIGSIALAKDIGVNEIPKEGGIEDGILYIIFPKSNKTISIKCYNHCFDKCNENCQQKCDKDCYELQEKLWCKPKTREVIINEGQELFNKWGGINKVIALFGKFPLTHNNILQ